MNWTKLSSIILLVLLTTTVGAQDKNVLLKEAENFERQRNEAEALNKYKEVLVLDPSNAKALVKATEMNVSLGNRLAKPEQQKIYFETALSFARRASALEPLTADAAYAMALASGKMTDVEKENKKIVAWVKEVHTWSEKALQIQPNHARALYTLGKWHFEMVTLAGYKKAAVKLFYGGLPEANLDKAIAAMEKCKTLEPYFAPNYLDLALAYKENNQVDKALENLNKLVKLPSRSSDDVAAKSAGQELLNKMQ
ncbi:MAG: hypothetical protein EAZ62_06010 [Sphingobacteriia bacterium]|nr:MAG: hypothetical protein EAZ62_06010 [Sphingobacteriia bacterium]